MELFIDIETLPPMPKDIVIDRVIKELMSGERKLPTRKKIPEKVLQETIDFCKDAKALTKYWKRLSLDIMEAQVHCIVVYFNDELHCFDGFDPLQEFCDFMIETVTRRPNFIGFNIKEFDLPLLYRALVINNYKCPFYPIPKGGSYKYHRDVIDLSEFWPSDKWKVSQYTLCKQLGIEDEFPEGSGKDVLYWYENDQSEKIVSHCKADVKQLVEIYERMKL